MNEIQQARDVLGKWRDGSLTQHWLTSIDDPALDAMPNGERALQFGSFAPGDARLIVGTAGNPELLDAIDEVLRVSLSLNSISPAVDFVAHRFTRAILAADGRMSA